MEIIPNISGRIEKILAKEGDRIKAGQPLALMSSTDRTAILDAAFSMGEKEYEYWQDVYKPIRIISPIDGTIILKNIVEGQTVSASEILFAVSDELIVKAFVDESEIGKVKEGQRARVTLDAYPDKTTGGRVIQILDEGKNVSNVITYTVKIRPFKSTSFFKFQMTANVEIITERGVETLVVSSRAIFTRPDGSASVITRPGEKPEYKAVKIGENFGDNVQIAGGLEEGDEIWMKKEDYALEKSDGGRFFLAPKRDNNSRERRRGMRRMRI